MTMMNGGRLRWSRGFARRGEAWHLISLKGSETAWTPRTTKNRILPSMVEIERSLSRDVLARRVAKLKPVPARKRPPSASQFASVTLTLVLTGQCHSYFLLRNILKLFPFFREIPGTDVSSSVETDKENDPMDDTDQLLDSTYNLGTTNAATIMGKCFVNSIHNFKIYNNERENLFPRIAIVG